MSKKKTIIRDVQAELDELIASREETYEPVIDIFQKNSILSEEHLDYISPIMQSIEFFKSSCPETIGLLDFTKLCCENLQFEYFPAGAAVFHAEEQGDKFYIVLRGKSGVYIRRNQQQIDVDEELVSQMVQKMKEKNPIDSSNTEQERIKFYEKVLKKQKQKPTKSIESELILLKSGSLDRYFNENGICKFMSVAMKYSGQYFGEMALTNDKPRTASIIALTDLTVLSLSKSNYKKVFESEIKTQQQKIDYFMRMFPNMTKFKMTKLIVYFSQHKYPANFVIWRQNDDTEGFFLLKEGEVQLLQNVDLPKMTLPKQESQFQILNKKKRENKEQKSIIILANLTSGCFVGETDIIMQHERREFTVKTLQTCQIFSLTTENYMIIKKSFPEFVATLQLIQTKSSNLIKRRIDEIVKTKSSNFYLSKKEEILAVERRYANEFDGKQDYELSPIIRSTMHTKLSKQQMVEQNQSIIVQHTRFDEEQGNNEEFNMLKMAGENFQKCLLIRVEKQFEKFQPAKPKGKTPYFTKSSKDIKDLLEQIRSHQLPQLTNTGTLSFRQQQNEKDDESNTQFFIKQKVRIINPNVQQKVDYIRLQLGKQNYQNNRRITQVNPRLSHKSQDQYGSGFLLTDAVSQYHPVHSTSNKQQVLYRTRTNMNRINSQDIEIQNMNHTQKVS